MVIEGITIRQIADELGIQYDTASKRLSSAGIKPILKEDLYPLEALETLRKTPARGRPPKPKPEA